MFDRPTFTPPDAPTARNCKRFTLAEARRARPYLERVVGDVVLVYQQVIGLRQELDQLDDDDKLHQLTTAEYQATMDRLGRCMDELHVVGVGVKDFERGTIEFPTAETEPGATLRWSLGDAAVEAVEAVEAPEVVHGGAPPASLKASSRPMDEAA